MRLPKNGRPSKNRKVALGDLRALPTTRRLLLFLAYVAHETSPLPRGLRMKAAVNLWPSQYVAELEREFKGRTLAALLSKLKERHFIEVRRVGEQMRCVLTDKGTVTAARERARLSSVLGDGRLLVVSFDIPERQRAARNALRSFLRGCGFTKWHDSLWVTERDVAWPVGVALKTVRGGKWVTMYEAREIKSSPRKT